jgi:hypothetical protein
MCDFGLQLVQPPLGPLTIRQVADEASEDPLAVEMRFADS